MYCKVDLVVATAIFIVWSERSDYMLRPLFLPWCSSMATHLSWSISNNTGKIRVSLYVMRSCFCLFGLNSNACCRWSSRCLFVRCVGPLPCRVYSIRSRSCRVCVWVCLIYPSESYWALYLHGENHSYGWTIFAIAFAIRPSS